ncbi:MAG: DNA-directed RNA polymerase [Candidatus Diapherotrites archaeon]|uniref:DNA-directed RNA polymerase subunit Rpo7 n=1 Tax=Candidatus Iainarchaeum sp. TaxID=3101447 RepID=A0A2D6M0J3_9ARCH|nr:DNA-directed RNA polymerase [Candidatus Diapherotrites archaeon]|tara:strand:- start:723 stop:1325 length:603 start_codon:yes stop_codon:yes gene_type:complete
MYFLVNVNEKVRVPPKDFGGKLKDTILKIVQEEYEGVVDEDLGLVIAVTGVGEVGEGKIVLGDGAAYYRTELELLMYKPLMHEVVEGSITEITEFGAFMRISPIEGLVHVSQIMDDYINYDAKMPGFIGKKTGRKLTVEDEGLARIVTISLKGNIQNSKIGLTMRQPFLGKEGWTKKDEKKEKDAAKAKEPVKEKKEKKG